jgi:hypothetical protein
VSEIADWGLVETAEAIAAKKVSAAEVTDAMLASIENRQPLPTRAWPHYAAPVAEAIAPK